MAAKRSGSPVVIRITYATCLLNCGQFTATHSNDEPHVTVAEAVALTSHIRILARYYGVPVILQSETRCHHRLSTWYDGLLAANKAYFAQHDEALYSSHILDLTHDVQDDLEILAVGRKFLEELNQIKIWLGLKINSSQQNVLNAFETMSPICRRFSLVVGSFPKEEAVLVCPNDKEKSGEVLLVLDEVSNESSPDGDRRSEYVPKLASTSFENFNVVQVNVGGCKRPSQIHEGTNGTDTSNNGGAHTQEDRAVLESEFLMSQYAKVMQSLSSENKYS